MNDELSRRLDLWKQLKNQGGPNGIAPELVESLRIHRGQRGIYRDLDLTRDFSPDGSGVAVGVLHTGEHYPDDLSESGVIYHYPQTPRESRDQGEIRSLAACRELQLPLFVVITPHPHSKTRNVRIGWVADLDDLSGQVLIVFCESPPGSAAAVGASVDQPFVLQEHRSTKAATFKARPNQWRFRYDVMKRYGPSCAFCGLGVTELLQAAHICPVEDGGSDDPRNGLVVCLNHHRAFDLGLILVDPDTFHVSVKEYAKAAALGVKYNSIHRLQALPHRDALMWIWGKYKEE